LICLLLLVYSGEQRKHYWRMKRPHPESAIKDMHSRAVMRWPSLSYGTFPLVIMGVMIVATIVGYSLLSASLELSRQRFIDRRIQESELRITDVFNAYAHLLWGNAGFMQSNDNDEASWQRFVGVYNTAKNFSGIEAVGVARGTSTSDLFIAYVNPKTDVTTSAIGLNIGRVPALQQTITRAAETGEATLSSPLPNILPTKQRGGTAHHGFVMVAPFYDQSLPQSNPNERLQAFRGVTMAVFRSDVFFPMLFSDTDLAHTSIKVYAGDPSPDHLLYAAGTAAESDIRRASLQLTEYGKAFTIEYTYDTAYMLSLSLTYLPLVLLIAGLTLGILFAGVAGYLLRSRYQRLTYEKERDVNFAKDELLSLASHQLRTPATGVKQYLGMVLQGFAGDLNEKQQLFLERAYASNNRQLNIINDVLHLAKLEAGRIVLAEREFNVADMMKEVVDEQRDDAEKSNISLRLIAPTKGLMVGDSHMLRMVVENLVSNAIKYTPAGGKVTVRLYRLGSHWIITVKDTGVGIARTDFDKLFKQFSRIENPLTESVTGTGIGLYLAHHLTLLHGGNIGVSSSKGKGTTFTVRLPRKM